MKSKIKTTMSLTQIKALAAQSGIKIEHVGTRKDLFFTGYSMRLRHKHKLDRLTKKWGVSRSGIIQLLVDGLEE